MIGFPYKRVFVLVGASRTGKDSVANYLVETRGFEKLAFADQIKEEFGISKEDFEAAKISGDIDQIRRDLWEFSASKKKDNPEYFISKITEKANDSKNSIVITDARTKEEVNAVLLNKNIISSTRAYWVKKDNITNFKNEILCGAQLTKQDLQRYDEELGIQVINNSCNGLYYFYKHLDKYFFYEDLKYLFGFSKYNEIQHYINQFDIKER